MASQGHVFGLSMLMLSLYLACGVHLSSKHSMKENSDITSQDITGVAAITTGSEHPSNASGAPYFGSDLPGALFSGTTPMPYRTNRRKTRPQFQLNWMLNGKKRPEKKPNITGDEPSLTYTSNNAREIDLIDLRLEVNNTTNLSCNCSLESDKNASNPEPASGNHSSNIEGSFGCLSLQSVPLAWTEILQDKELLCVTNRHWLEFEPPSKTSHKILAVIYMIVLIVGTFGNAAVIFLFISSRTLRTASNLLILNLAVSDFFLLITISALVHNSVHEGPATGRIGCDVYGFLGGLTGTTSIMTLAAISLDRYLVISFPLDPFKRLSYRQVLVIIMLTWMYSFVFSVIPLVGIVGIHYSPEGFLTSCSFDYLTTSTRTRVYIFSFFVAAWVLPLYIISFSYISIVNTVSKQERHCYSCRKTLVKSFKRQSMRGRKKVEVKLAKVASGIIGLWVLAWTPYSIVALLGIFNQRRLITPIVSMIPAIFCKSAACLDPYVYALSHPRFKAEIRKRLCNYRSKSILDSTRNGAIPGVSASTVSEIREERELSEPQVWDVSEPSTSTLGPLLQHKNSFCSHPALNSATTKSRASLNSPGSRSLVSPVTSEVYPRKSISTYSFRGTSKSLNFSEIREFKKLNRSERRHSKPSVAMEYETTVLVEVPNGKNSTLPPGRGIVSEETKETILLSTESVSVGSPSAVNGVNDSAILSADINCAGYLDMTVFPFSCLPSICVVGHQPKTSNRRSNSLPNIKLITAKGSEENARVNSLFQFFRGEVVYRGRKNNSCSSLNPGAAGKPEMFA
ncbi:melanopsin-like isoform X1 [Macrobrachium rosenbergii]|uniref:melanopsin-like isoform X1 n=1 Tax=Macrobrachium rosenbergii TaxID=79674 RepID=UPI0034D4BBD1